MKVSRDGEKYSGKTAQELLCSETGKMAAKSCPLTIQRTQAHLWNSSGCRPLSWATQRRDRRVTAAAKPWDAPSVELQCAALNMAVGGHSAKTSLGGGVASASESEWLLQPDPLKSSRGSRYDSAPEDEDGEGGVDTELPYMLGEHSCPICHNEPDMYYYD